MPLPVSPGMPQHNGLARISQGASLHCEIEIRRISAEGSKPEFTALQQQWPVSPQITDITVANSTCAADVTVWPLRVRRRCAGERAASSPQHAPDRRRMDSIGTRYIRLRLAIGKPLERFLIPGGSPPKCSGMSSAKRLRM